MIVKDEAHIILETLQSVSKYIDYYVICDTGSSDNTKEIIKIYFDSINIEGVILDHEWKNFCHNRTLALQACDNLSDYIWVIDADDIVVGNLTLPENMEADAYSLIYGNDFTYNRLQIYKNKPEFMWSYKCPVHEYPHTVINNFTNEVIRGDYYIDSRRLGARSNNPNKYLLDAIALKEYLPIAGDDYARCVFYMANSYYDHGGSSDDIEKYMLLAIEAYKERISLNGWYEEVYYSYYKTGQAYEKLHELDPKRWNFSLVQDSYMAAFNYCKERVEPIYELTRIYNNRKNYKKAFECAKLGINVPYPENAVLFIYKSVYEYEMPCQYIEASLNTDNVLAAYSCCKKTMSKTNDKCRLNHLYNLLNQCKTKMLSKTNNCLIYLGNNLNIKYLDKYVELLQMQYNVYLYSDYVNYNMCSYDVNYLVDLNNNIKFSQIFLFDNIPIKQFPNHTTLIVNNNTLATYGPNGIKLEYLQVHKNFKNFNKILCLNIDIKNNLLKMYNFKDVDTLDSIDNLLIKKYYKYNLNNDIININDRYNFIVPKYIKNNQYNELVDKMINYTGYNELEYYKCSQYILMCEYDKAIESLKKVFNKNDIEYIIQELGIKLKMGKYDEVYNHCINLKVPANYMYPNDTRLERIQESCYDNIKDRTIYPDTLIKKIKNNNKNKILLTMTTCKRYNLFKKTMNSFINCCLDHHLIDQWYIIDDNSDMKDRKLMQEKYPFVNFIFKTELERGHYNSMNIIYSIIENNDFTYWIHLEDDFLFVNKRNYITECITILNSDPTYGQALFNRNYAEVEHHKIEIKGGILKNVKLSGPKGKTPDDLYYIEHEHYDKNLEPEKYNEFYKNNIGNNCMYWPHFSFRPSVMKTEVIKKVGPFSNCTHFEMQYAKEYNNLKFKSVFLNAVNHIHIGKKTWEQGDNAYNLNSIEQFTNTNEEQINIIYDNFLTKEQKTKINQVINNKYNLISLNDYNYDPKNILNYKNNNFNNHHKLIIFNTIIKDLLSINANKLTILFEPTIVNYDINDDYDITILDENNLNIIIHNQDAINILNDKLNNMDIQDNIINYINNDNFPELKINRTNSIISNNIFDCKNEYYLEGYKFYPKLDSFGNDLSYEHEKSVYELKKICDENNLAKGFNTLGWIKNIIVPENDFCELYMATNYSQGLYVKI